MKATKNWGTNWLLTYDLENADGIGKKDIVQASTGKFVASAKWEQDSLSYDMPSTTLWAFRDKFTNIIAVKDAFYTAVAQCSKEARVKKLIICDFQTKQLYIENN